MDSGAVYPNKDKLKDKFKQENIQGGVVGLYFKIALVK
jgi:hypothetical protein